MSLWWNGWRLTGFLAALLVLMVLIILGVQDFTVDSIRTVIRATARTSLLLFLPAFAASALARLRPGSVSRWLLRNRRYLGVSFAVSHGLHGLAILAFALRDPVLFGEMTTHGTLATGGLSYAFIALMAATSFDRAVTWLGMRNWRLLHWSGVWYIALSFIVTNARRTLDMPFYWLPVVLMLLAVALRLAGWWRARRSAAAIRAPA